MNKGVSIIIPLKNRTSIVVDYSSIPIKHLQRHHLELSKCPKRNFEFEVPKGQQTPKIRINLLLECLNSLNKIRGSNELFEVILVDFKSDDYPLSKLINRYPRLNIQIIEVNEHFSRGKGLNIGFQQATQDYIFFCDADMLFRDHEVFDLGYQESEKGNIFFPICFHLSEPSHQIGFWRDTGYGISFTKKETIHKYNYQLSEYDSLGKEDDDIWQFFNKKKLTFRLRVKNYFHQWHPDSSEFKNKYYKNNDVKKLKIFLNLNEESFDLFCKRIMERNKDKAFLTNEYFYIINKLEKFTNIIINFREPEYFPLMSLSDINRNKEINRDMIVINNSQTLIFDLLINPEKTKIIVDRIRVLKLFEKKKDRKIKYNKKVGLPIDFHWHDYITLNKDLNGLNKSMAEKHYLQRGKRENRNYKIKCQYDEEIKSFTPEEIQLIKVFNNRTSLKPRLKQLNSYAN